MENSKTHKLCSVSVEFSTQNDFKFLVPNHLVDENGNIDEEITYEIRDKFENEQLLIDDCQQYQVTTYEVFVKDDFSVDKEIGDDDVELHSTELFGE